jgi:hypothetical protein
MMLAHENPPRLHDHDSISRRPGRGGSGGQNRVRSALLGFQHLGITKAY